MNMIKLLLLDASGVVVDESVLTPPEAADKAREYVFLQGADPDHGGVGAMVGQVLFEPVKLDNPVQKSPFLAPYAQNFEVLKRACKNGDLALMQCRWKKTDSPVAVICAIERMGDGSGYKPLGMMFAANPYELVVPDVGAVNRVPVTDGEKLLAELHELEGRAHAIRLLLQRGASTVDTVAVLPVNVIVDVPGGAVSGLSVLDATGAEVRHTQFVTDHGDDCDDKLTPCQKCGAGDVIAVQVEKDGFLYRCDACGHSFVGLLDGSEDAAEMRRLQKLDPLRDVVEDKNVPDGR